MSDAAKRRHLIAQVLVIVVCLSSAAILYYVRSPARRPAPTPPTSGGHAGHHRSPAPPVLIDRPAAAKLNDPPRIAFTGIQPGDSSWAAAQAAEAWSPRLADLLALDDQAQWVERQVLDQVVDELTLTRQLSDDADVLQIGRWSQADLVLHASVDREADGRRWTIKLIDTATTETVATQSWLAELDPDPADPLGLEAGYEVFLDRCRTAIAEGIAAAKTRRNQTRIAGLFVRNLSPSSRLSEFGPQIMTKLGEAAGRAAGLHLVRFDQPMEAGREQTLVAMGLAESDSQPCLSVADYYVWGTVEQGESRGVPDPSRWELRLEIWDGGSTSQKVELSGQTADLARGADEAVRQVLAKLPAKPSATFDTQMPARLAGRLIDQSRTLQRDLVKRSPADRVPTTQWGWQVFRGREKLAELACFFDPSNPQAWSTLLSLKREGMLGDPQHQYPRIIDYLSTRKTARRVAGSDALRRETVDVPRDLLRLMSGGWGITGLPDGMNRSHLRAKVQPLIIELLQGEHEPSRQTAELLQAVLAAHATTATKIEAVETLWPAIRPRWQEHQRHYLGKSEGSVFEALDEKVGQLLVRADREDLLRSIFTLEAEGAVAPVRQTTQAKQPPTPPAEIESWDMRWQRDASAVLRDEVPITGITPEDSLTPAWVKAAQTVLGPMGIESAWIGEIESLATVKPKATTQDRSRLHPLVAGSDGYVVAAFSQEGSTRRGDMTAERDTTLGGSPPLLYGYDDPLRTIYPLGDDLQLDTHVTALASTPREVWIGTSTDGLIRLDLEANRVDRPGSGLALLDRRVQGLAANDEFVVAGFADQSSLSVKRLADEDFADHHLDLKLRRPGVTLWGILGSRVLLSDAGGGPYVYDVQQRELIEASRILRRASPTAMRSRLEVQAGAADDQAFWLLADRQLLRLAADGRSAQSWALPDLDWQKTLVSDGRTVWLQAAGPETEMGGRPGLLFAWDIASASLGKAILTGRLWTRIDRAGRRIWLSQAGLAQGWPAEELRGLAGFTVASEPPPAAVPAALTQRRPPWMDVPVDDPSAIAEAIASGVLTREHRTKIDQILAAAMAADQPEPILAFGEGLSDSALRGVVNVYEVMEMAGAQAGPKVIDALASSAVGEEAQLRRWAMMYSAATAGRLDHVQQLRPQLDYDPRQQEFSGHDKELTQRFKGLKQSTPLQAAAYRGHLEIVRQLMPISGSRNRSIAGALATLAGHREVLAELLQPGHDLAYHPHNQMSAPQIAVILGDEAALDLMTQRFPEATASQLCEPEFITRLFTLRSFAALARLAERGVALDIRQPAEIQLDSRSPLLRATGTPLIKMIHLIDAETLQRLIDLGLNFEHEVDGLRLGDALLIHASVRNPPFAKTLVDAGFDPRAVDGFGATPLLAATLGRQAGLVDLYLRRGADPRQPHRDGATAVTLAEAVGGEIQQRLAGASTASPSEKRRGIAAGAAGPSPWLAAHELRLAIDRGDLASARQTLASAAVDFDDKAGAGKAVLHYAIDHDQPVIAKLIAEQDWTLTSEYYVPVSRFHDALEKGYVEVAETILARAGWRADRRAEILEKARTDAESRGDQTVLEWLATEP